MANCSNMEVNLAGGEFCYRANFALFCAVSKQLYPRGEAEPIGHAKKKVLRPTEFLIIVKKLLLTFFRTERKIMEHR